jgi:hypothetical protein
VQLAPLPATLTATGIAACVSQTASDVKRGHWEPTISCFEALAKAEAEKVATPPVAEVEEAPIAQTDATEPTPIAPATPSTPAPATPAAVVTAPTATGENEELPNRGDNGRGRLQPMPVKKVSTVQISGKNREEPATKKLMLTLVAVKRISSDVAASNFDQNELEIAGELASGDRRFCYSQACWCETVAGTE